MNISQRRIDALRAMAKSGTKHEQESARAILARLDIDETEDEPVEYFKISIKNEFEIHLLFQTADMVLGNGDWIYREGNSQKTRFIRCTKSEHDEVSLFFESFLRALQHEMEITYRAFIQRNNIFSPEAMANPVEAIDEESKKTLRRAATMDSVEIRKRITAGGVT